MDGADAIRAGVLGPTSLAVGRHPVDLGPVRPRLVLAKLVLNAGQVVRPEQLADIVWPHERPSSWGVQLQSAVMVVRKALSGAGCGDAKLVLATTGGGYRFDVDPSHTDLGRFRAGVAAASHALRCGDEAAALRYLRRAEALWRGPALADVRTHGMEAEARRLDDQLLDVLEQRLELELADGLDRVDELAELADRHPWRERLHELLMTALWRRGRAADALTHYRALHARYVDELGIEPGSRLAELHHRILDQARRPPAPTPAPVGVPHQLPPAVPHLVGRDGLVAAAVARLRGAPAPGSAAVVALYGPAGIGKTATAAAAAHAVAADFPDGQVFVRLGDASGRAAGPREAVAQVLRALHGPDVEVPGTVAEAAANLRTSTFGRRVLLWLEDATDLSVVRPLLPASPTCAVLVTSRPPLVGLEQATHLRVPPLDERPARELLVTLMGSGPGSGPGPASDPDSDEGALRSVVLRCAGLPLALRIVGSRLAVGGPATLEAAARALDEGGEHLDWLVAGDLDLRGTLRFALSDAGAAARRLFELLTAVGVTALPTWAAAALLDADEDTAGRAAHELAHLGLVEVDRDGVRVHALVLAFAASLAPASR
ncbi:MAG TPA: AfsR/SARP family transcriptional regulator, partial [Pseudonocardiaceae bacterium]